MPLVLLFSRRDPDFICMGWFQPIESEHVLLAKIAMLLMIVHRTTLTDF